MTKWYITFSGSNYHKQTSYVMERATKMGADKVLIYDDVWLTQYRRDFCQKNKWFFDYPEKRGFGWYIWKPFIILDALRRAESGDIVMYIDGDTYPIHDFSMLYPLCKKQGGVMVFEAVGQCNSRWCKRDCFIVMGQDDPRFRFAPHGCARFMLFEKGLQLPHEFLENWLKYLCIPEANTVAPSHLAPEYPEYVEHRSDQSVMTNLIHRYGLRLFREACQFGSHVTKDKDLFPQLFEQMGGHNPSPTSCEGSMFRNVND